MDFIIPQDEEIIALQQQQDNNNNDENNNNSIDLYEYEDIPFHHNHDNDHDHNNHDSYNNASSQRRINVITTSSHHGGNTGTTHAYSTDPNNNNNNSSSSLGKKNIILNTLPFLKNSNTNTNNYDITNTTTYQFNTRILFYSPPRQRQKWYDTQILPHINWGDLFFDLFYVGLTYNVSTIIYTNPTIYGLLYSSSTFLAVMNIWTSKTMYDARYAIEESDIFHRFIIMIGLTLLGITISNIRTIDILSNPYQYSSMFLLSCMLVIERIFMTLFYIEIYFYGIGQQQMKPASIRECIYSNVSLPFFIASMILSGLHYFNNNNDNNNDMNYDDNYNNTDYYNNMNDTSHRILAASSTTSDMSYTTSTTRTTHIPIILCLLGSIVKLLTYAASIIFCLPKDGRHKEVSVPLNVDFVIHRHGEWMMLMLGESIFSILIVQVDHSTQKNYFNFYFVFYSSTLIVILLQLLHFQSQPHIADLHAVRRDKNRGMLWSLLQSVYSLALVIMGATYTFFLQYAASDSNNDSRRFLVRELASSSGSDVVDPSHQAGAAHLFSGSLAIVFLSLNVMTLLHLNADEIKVLCLLKMGNTGVAMLAIIMRFGVIIVASTISQWTYNPKWITLTGLCCVIADLAMRKMSSIYLSLYHQSLDKTAQGGSGDNGQQQVKLTSSGKHQSTT